MRIVTTAPEKTLAGDILIPGWADHPDLVPASPSAYDDEFTGPLSAAWTEYNPTAIATVDAGSTFASHLYMEEVPAGTSDPEGIYRSCPPPPFTVTAKLVDGVSSINQSDNFSDAGLFVGDGAPGRMLQISSISNQAGTTYNLEVQLFHSPTSYIVSPLFGPNTPGYGTFLPVYLRWVVASATDFSAYTSWSGRLWTPRMLHYNPADDGETFSGVNCIGITVNRDQHNHTVIGVFDWIRVT